MENLDNTDTKNEDIKKRALEIQREFDSFRGKKIGFDLLQAAWYFFSEIAPHPINDFDGRDEFNRFVGKRIDFANRYENFSSEEVLKNRIEEKVVRVVDEYVIEQSFRLATERAE